MILKVGHIGIAVGDIERALDQLCRSLVLDRPQVKTVSNRRMKVAVVDLGLVSLELLEDTDEDGPFAGLVKERGSFIHHLSLLTDDIDREIAELKDRGVRMVDDKPYVGLRGKWIAFVASGILDDIPIELSEP